MSPTRPFVRAAVSVVAVSFITLAGLARADEQEHRGPPPEALSACDGKASGAECSFSHEGHALSGTCWAPEGRPLACRPAGGPPPR